MTGKLFHAQSSNSMKMFRKDGSKSFIFTLVILMFFCDKTSSECTWLTPCSCIFPDGQGYNVTQLSNSEPLKAAATAATKNRTIFFHPCSNIPMANTSECYKGKGVSVCLVDSTVNKSISLGTTEETTLSAYEDATKHSSLIVRHENYVTKIGLACCSYCNNTHLVVDSVVNDKDYNLLLLSRYACKELLRSQGLSTGSLLIIFFFVIIGIYFIGGAITLKLIRGATGWEMIPNHKFWRDLPSLVRDGIDYTFNGCHVSSYERIGA